jgi:hypothetical protein
LSNLVESLATAFSSSARLSTAAGVVTGLASAANAAVAAARPRATRNGATRRFTVGNLR